MAESEHDGQGSIISRDPSRSRHMKSKRNDNSASSADVFLKPMSRRQSDGAGFTDAVVNQSNQDDSQVPTTGSKQKQKEKDRPRRRTTLDLTERDYLLLYEHDGQPATNQVATVEEFRGSQRPSAVDGRLHRYPKPS